MNTGIIDRALDYLADHAVVKQDSVSGYTDANGNIQVTGVTAKVLLFGWNGVYAFIPFFWNNGWYFRVIATDAAGAAIKNTYITVNFYYLA